MKVAIVAAVAENGVIGADGEMPWHYPADLERFKELTVGHPVIVGRKTYEAIVDRLGHPLPERLNVVLTSQELDLPDGAVAAHSVEAALDAAGATESDVVYVIGGAAVYEQFLPLADELHLTEIPESPPGDTYFPDWDATAWRLRATEERGALRFRTYERR